MIPELTNHLWQSTLIALAAGALSLAFRKNFASVRYWLWFSASVKFLVPFSLLVSVGSYAGWTPVSNVAVAPSPMAFVMVQMTQPFSSALPAARIASGSSVDWIAWALSDVWLCGFITILLLRWRGWLAIRAALRSSAGTGITAALEVRSTPGLLEPGVVGWLRPVVLLPDGIVERLPPLQLDAVLAHEFCHVQRHDNSTAAIHMLVEAVFWFYPVVWWIGARLLEERERACDEAVLELGNEAGNYAEAIVHVCKSYLESPLSCASGVTGANLHKRIETILTGKAPKRLNFAKRLALGVAGFAAVAVPVAIGASSAATSSPSRPGAALSAVTDAAKFESVSIEPCAAFSNGKVPESPGRLQSGCTTLQRLMQEAYGVYADIQANPLSSVTITGGPAWTDSALYEIGAKADGREGQVMMKGPMLRTLLEDRFKLKVHRESREIPVYELTAAKRVARLQPFGGNCVPWDYDHPNPGPRQCATARFAGNGIDMKGWTMADLCYFLLVTLREPVVDRTGNTGRFDLHLELSTEAAADLRHGARGAPARTDLAVPATDPLIISSVTSAVEKLGLHIEAGQRTGEFIVIDSATRPL